MFMYVDVSVVIRTACVCVREREREREDECECVRGTQSLLSVFLHPYLRAVRNLGLEADVVSHRLARLLAALRRHALGLFIN
jgi:hypothetical protein